jgi:hypothetical protein
MKTDIDSLKYIQLSYDMRSDEIKILEDRIQKFLEISGTLVIIISGLVGYINSIKLSTISTTFFFISIISFLGVFILSIGILFPKSDSGKSINKEDKDIKWGKLPDLETYGKFVDKWSNIEKDLYKFIEDEYLLNLWAKQIIINNKIKEYKWLLCIFLIALIFSVIGSLLLFLDLTNIQ